MHALARMKGALLCSEFLQPYFTRAEQHLDLYGEMQTPCATCELRVDSSTRQQRFTHDKPSGTISVIVLCGGMVWLKAYHNCWSCPAVSADIHRWLFIKAVCFTAVSFNLDADARQHAADDPELQLGTLLQTACLVNLVLDHSASAEGPRTTAYPLMPPDGWSGIARRGISPELEAQVKACSREVLAMNTQDFAQDFGQSSEGHSSEGYSSELGSSSAASSDNAGSAHRTQQPLAPSKAAKMLPTPTAASWEEVKAILLSICWHVHHSPT